MAFIYSLADTWNDGATTFKGISLNVTDTASAAGSLLMDLQVGGVSQFSVSKAGQINLSSGTAAAPAIRSTDADSGMFFSGNNIRFSSDGTNRFSIDGQCNLNLSSISLIRWTNSASDPNAGHDVILARDAANTLAQRNGVNAQAFNLYNTYTDASNYERGFMRWSSNALTIGNEALGTGTATRQVRFTTSNTPGVAAYRFESINDQIAVVQLGGTNGFITLAGGNGALSAQCLVTSQLNTGTSINHFLAANGNNTTQYFALSGRAAGVMQINGGTVGSGAVIETFEVTAPAAPAANGVRIYAEDNGAGKTRLMALFPTGVAQQIAIEP